MIPRLAPALLAMLLIVTACAGTTEITSRNIIKTIPWHAPETTKYQLIDKSNNNIGTGVLKVETADAGLRFTQHYDYPGKAFVNDAQVVADRTGLQTGQPISRAT